MRETRGEGETDNDVITRVLDGATPKKDDIFVVKTLISGDKYSYTAYVYNGSAWAAMDGNYNAESVYFDEDLLTTSAIGNITLTNGQATIPATGKNLKELFQTIYVQEKNPTITQPSVNLTFAQAGAYEVGTSITPSYSASLNPGSYQYGPATGVTATAWAISDTASHSASTASGEFDPVVVADGTNYTITAQATHGAGATPKTNVGNDYASGAIQAGTKSKTSSAITGFRNSFYGTVTNKDSVTSAVVRRIGGQERQGACKRRDIQRFHSGGRATRDYRLPGDAAGREFHSGRERHVGGNQERVYQNNRAGGGREWRECHRLQGVHAGLRQRQRHGEHLQGDDLTREASRYG